MTPHSTDEQKHTAGVQVSEEYVQTSDTDTGIRALAARHFDMIEGSWSGSLRDLERFAAAVIAEAVPDLLEALKQLMGWVDSWDPNFVHDEDWPEAKHHIKAAIAKAEGRS